MPRFTYRARDLQGHAIDGVATALDEHDLDRMLESQSLVLVDARTVKGARGRAVAPRARIDFCYHLAIAAEAGIPLVQALRDLREQNPGSFGEVLADVILRIESGSGFSEALAEHPSDFPPLLRAAIRAGETSGKLDQVLRDLVRHLEWREDLRRQVRSAIAYPSVVLLGLVALLGVIAVYVLPTFLGLFVELGVELPLATRLIVAGYEILSSHGSALLLAGVAAAAALVLYGRTGPGRNRIDALLLRIPVIGDLVTMIEASRFAHNLGLLFASGLPIPRCLEMVSEILQNHTLRRAVLTAREALDRGERLADAIGRSELMPVVVSRMIAIGEESGRLDQALERAAAFYDREVPVRIERLLLGFNTSVLVALGATLAIIALAVFVPLYSMLGNLVAQ